MTTLDERAALSRTKRTAPRVALAFVGFGVLAEAMVAGLYATPPDRTRQETRQSPAAPPPRRVARATASGPSRATATQTTRSREAAGGRRTARSIVVLSGQQQRVGGVLH